MSNGGAAAEACVVRSPGVMDGRNVDRRFSVVAEQTGQPQAAVKADVRMLINEAQRREARRQLVLGAPQFLAQLQREMRRADRSKGSLSIVQFRSCGSSDSRGFGPERLDGLADFLSDEVRETDVLGYTGEDSIGVLLPDTDEAGVQRFMNRISGEVARSFSSITATYPDQIFDDLAVLDSGPRRIAGDEFEFSERKTVQLAVKRAIDFLGSLAGIVLLSPVLLATAIAIAVNSPGPIIFKQIRVGRGGKPFSFYKFRSMRTDVDDKIHREYVTNLIQGNLETINQGDASKPLYKLKSDPRVTSVGRIIRKTSIDELPQLFNVLKGDMSLVGPRPPLPYEVEKYKSWHLRRVLEAKPGITGLWQVEGRSRVTFEEMVRMDLRYHRNWSLMLDLRILMKTVKVVFECSGAN